VFGPYASPKKALAGAELEVNDTTQSVDVRTLTAIQLTKLLRVAREGASAGHVVRLNGEEWVVCDDLTLSRRARPPVGKKLGSRHPSGKG
jgi:hypothetical protein